MLNPAYERGLSALDDQLCQRWTDPGIARDVFYYDCDDQTAQAALDRLRPQSINPAMFPFSLTEHPRLPTTYVVCSDDRMLRPEWSRKAVGERLDAALIELPGGHSPMLSAPQVLADVLLGLA
jgi:pimeloyl-ACP methyl ester carboxylesterase